MKILLSAFVSITVWIIGCAVADYVLVLDANSWRMLWGFFVGIMAILAGDIAERRM